ncbi:MAG: hypothetical protein HYS51_01640 [Candidatus Zambryskibacteria bacterium]|nr:hypothetical protein [Candidatus Zambryskibacteria bacterium]
MRQRLALAFLVSTTIIGAALWQRVSTTSYVKPALEITPKLDVYQGISDEDFVRDFTEPTKADSTVAEKPLTNTDIIGRQLVSDYIGLVVKGGAGTETINTLAEQYASIVPSLNKSAKLTYTDIRTAPTTEDNLKYYGNEIDRIYVSYSELINKAYSSSRTAYYSFAKDAVPAYLQIIEDIKMLSVPLPLASTHLELINLHLSNLSAAESIQKAEEDPLTAFAGFIAINDNSEKEIALLKEIEQTIQINAK